MWTRNTRVNPHVLYVVHVNYQSYLIIMYFDEPRVPYNWTQKHEETCEQGACYMSARNTKVNPSSFFTVFWFVYMHYIILVDVSYVTQKHIS